MERRIESRTATSHPAVLTILGKPAREMKATLEDFSSRGVRLVTPTSIPVNTPVEIVTENVLILGDVCRCSHSSADASYHVAVKVAHRLSLLTQLSALNRSLAKERQEELVTMKAPHLVSSC